MKKYLITLSYGNNVIAELIIKSMAETPSKALYYFLNRHYPCTAKMLENGNEQEYVKALCDRLNYGNIMYYEGDWGSNTAIGIIRCYEYKGLPLTAEITLQQFTQMCENQWNKQDREWKEHTQREALTPEQLEKRFGVKGFRSLPLSPSHSNYNG